MSAEPVETPRGRGRPRRTEAERDETRELILEATGRVFGEHGYHAATAARISAAAGIAKSHFYKHYANAAEPLGIMLDRFGQDLVDRVRAAMSAAGPTAEEQLFGAIEGYLAWGAAGRHLIRSFTAGMHDPTTPVAGVRARTVAEAEAMIWDVIDRLGRPRPTGAEIDVFLNTLEYTSYRLQTTTDGGPEAVGEARSLMLRAAIAFLGDAQSWRDALHAPGFVRSRD